MKISFLKDCQQFIPEIALCYYNEWGYIAGVESVENEIEKTHTFLQEDLPFMLVAHENSIFLGVIQLKFFEMDCYPNYEHWLGGVYVRESYRKKGVAKALIEEGMKKANQLGVQTVYLQTERKDGGLYTKLGWKPVECKKYKGVNVLVMKRSL